MNISKNSIKVTHTDEIPFIVLLIKHWPVSIIVRLKMLQVLIYFSMTPKILNSLMTNLEFIYT